jgi:hypothetical protein
MSNRLESTFCVEALEVALTQQQPEIFNTDQGVQFTSRLFTDRLAQAGVSISMDGRGRALDNVFVERLWWSVKYEHVYLHDHQTVQALHHGLTNYLLFFNRERRHRSLEYHTPWDVCTVGSSWWWARRPGAEGMCKLVRRSLAGASLSNKKHFLGLDNGVHLTASATGRRRPDPERSVFLGQTR